MKKIIYLLLLLIPIGVMAQLEKVTFTKKLTYEFNFKGIDVDVTVCYSPEAIVLESKDLNGNRKLFIKPGLVAAIDLDLDRKVTSISSPEKISEELKLEKTGDTDSFEGISCNYYREKGNSKLKMCIAENNPVNLLNFIVQEGIPVNGLIVNIIEEEKKEAITMTLKSVEDFSGSIFIDLQDIVSITEYINERKKIEEDLIEVEVYVSEYKNPEIVENANELAIDLLEKDSFYWGDLPKYCTDLDTNIPDFSNKELKKHTRNYAGRLCDMYLGLINVNRINKKLTFDMIRYEEEYFRNNRDKFSKKDIKLLDKFLNNLD